MRVLGVRASTKHIRYCVLDLNGADVVWVNKDEEHKWVVPKASTTKAARLNDAHQEMLRLLNKYKPDSVAVKIAETPRGHPDPHRVSVEAVIVLAAAQQHVPVIEKRYRDLKTKSAEVETVALGHVTKPSKHWDSELADAIVAGLRELGK